MKIFIIDGCDNTGKTTLINNLIAKIDKDYNDNAFIDYQHCEKPVGRTNEEKWAYQQKMFLDISEDIIDDYINKDFDFVILDRFVEGEFVYGPVYREEDPDEVMIFVRRIQRRMLSNIDQNDIIYVSLTGDAEFIASHDDGKSLSSNDIVKIKDEIDKFKEIFDASLWKNKILIKINNGDNWIDKNTILNIVTDYAGI